MRKKIVILSIVCSLFFLSIVNPASAQWDVSNLESFQLPDAEIGDIVANIADWLVAIFAFFGIIGFTISGIMYLVSTGDEEMIKNAKKYMTYSILGIIVGLSGYVVILAIDAFLNANSNI